MGLLVVFGTQSAIVIGFDRLRSRLSILHCQCPDLYPISFVDYDLGEAAAYGERPTKLGDSQFLGVSYYCIIDLCIYTSHKPTCFVARSNDAIIHQLGKLA